MPHSQLTDFRTPDTTEPRTTENASAQRLRLVKRVCASVAVVPLTAILWIAPAAVHAQARDAISEAQRFRDAGNLTAAAQLLRIQVARNPDDGEARRLLAQTLYWLKDLAGARAVYDSALVRHPEDTTLRLQYARMLAETGNRARARALLTPLLDIAATRADAATLLGSLAYWEGDVTTARDLFVEALATNPAQEEARRQLREILASTAPWVSVSGVVWHDDQPLDHLALGLEAGWFATPLTKVIGRGQPARYRIDDSTHTIGIAEVAVANYAPSARLETELVVGGVRHAQGGNGNALDWTGRAALGVRLPQHVTLRARVERTPYLYTTASLDTPVMVQTAAGLFHWDDPRGWLGEAAYQEQHYPDDNATRTAYGWLLAPVVHQSGGTLQTGYAFAASHADASRFVLASPTQPFPPTDPRFSTAGRYVPYYTPSHLVTHSAIASLTLGSARGATFHVNGSFAVRATDAAPFFAVSGGELLRGTNARTFSPWSARASLAIPLHGDLTLEPTGEIGRTAFYSWATATLQVTYHFTDASTRRAGTP